MLIFITVSLAIAIVAFLGVRWTLARIIKSDTLLRRVLTWVATIVLITMLYAGFIILAIFYDNYYPQRDFNEAMWRADREKRYEMTDDLIRRKILIGRTTEEVQTMLGKSLSKHSDDRWVYDVGTKPGFYFDPDLLFIDFDQGKVAHVEQYTK